MGHILLLTCILRFSQQVGLSLSKALTYMYGVGENKKKMETLNYCCNQSKNFKVYYYVGMYPKDTYIIVNNVEPGSGAI